MFGRTAEQLAASEKAMRESETPFGRVVEAALSALVIVDYNGMIALVNAEAEKVFGYSRAEMLGTDVGMLIPERFRGHDQALRGRLFTNVPPSRPMGVGRDLFGLRKDGTEFPMEIGLNPIQTDEGALVVATIVDITECRRVALLNEQKRRALERSNADLEEFAYIASHDLREPLRGIASNARFLQEDYADKLDQTGVNRLLRMRYLTNRMEQLINDLLHFSKLSHPESAIQVTDLNQVIRNIESMSETLLTERNAVIITPRKLPVVLCNKLRITEVFRNLITNAVKYNDKATRNVEIGYYDSVMRNNIVQRRVCYVKDNGIGIAGDFHDDIFRIFKRLNTEDPENMGTGVGLTFVRRIVERDGGQVWLDSTPGEGSTFYFTMNLGDS